MLDNPTQKMIKVLESGIEICTPPQAAFWILTDGPQGMTEASRHQCAETGHCQQKKSSTDISGEAVPMEEDYTLPCLDP
eukprot:10331906-Karenia_brevis.AAC.1